jgi:hypothetical protein
LGEKNPRPGPHLMLLLTTDHLFFLTDLSCVGFVPVGDLLDIKGDKKLFTFVGKNGTSRVDFF